ncbi:MAG: ABC transporter permease [Sulfurovum sp.]
MKKEFITLEDYNNYIKLTASNDWRLQNITQIQKELKKIKLDKKLIWDLSDISDFDSAGVLVFSEYLDKFKLLQDVEVVGYTSKQHEMYNLLQNTNLNAPKIRYKTIFERLGERVMEIYREIVGFINFLGYLFYSIYHSILHPKDIRFKEMVYHIHQSGFNALIIIGMTSFLVGMVISYQGSVQLAKFGADMFIVDTIGISITRELAPMITAIVIAGRSGSAYTAEIGAMKITEEISAMRTMGFDPYLFLVLPRIFALMISLPLLIFFADIMGIFGGMVASKLELGISYGQFIDRLYEVLDVKHFLLGMIKGPVFAFVIATIGCYRGFGVSNNTQSLGLQTTASVVNGIFLVIAFDALFSVIFTELGV